MTNTIIEVSGSGLFSGLAGRFEAVAGTALSTCNGWRLAGIFALVLEQLIEANSVIAHGVVWN